MIMCHLVVGDVLDGEESGPLLEKVDTDLSLYCKYGFFQWWLVEGKYCWHKKRISGTENICEIYYSKHKGDTPVFREFDALGTLDRYI